MIQSLKDFFPPIGLRIIKTAIAVFVCFIIDSLRPDSIPFYSVIAAILCMQPYMSNSMTTAINRTIATFTGGLLGMLILVIDRQTVYLDSDIVFYILISFSVLVLIYFTVIIKKTAASYITCVVFLSVTVVHGEDLNPYLFAMNRIIDTLIGIFISLGVNAVHFPVGHHKKTLFIIDVDDVFDQSVGENLNTFMIKLNQLMERGIHISYVTRHSLSNVRTFIHALTIKSPILLYGGACLYDVNQNKIINAIPLNTQIFEDIIAFTKHFPVSPFIHALENNDLHIHYDSIQTEGNASYYNEIKTLPHQNVSRQALHPDAQPLAIVLVDHHYMIGSLYDELHRFISTHPQGHLVQQILLKHGIDKHYAQIMIVPHESQTDYLLQELMDSNNSDYSVLFGTKSVPGIMNRMIHSAWYEIPRHIQKYPRLTKD